MSVEFTLTGSTLSLDDWDRLLEDYTDYDLIDEEDGEFSQSGVAHLLVEGSIRGVLLYHDGPGLITVRLSALSSRADWRTAYGLVRDALAEGGGTFERESGETYDAARLSDAHAEQDAVADFCPTLGMVRQALEQDAKTIELPLGRFSLLLGEQDLPAGLSQEDVPRLEERLAERVYRYATAFCAKTFLLEGGVRLSTWAQIPTVVGRAHLVACSAFEEPIPTEVLVEHVSDHGAEALGGGGFYLPELQLDEHPQLKETLGAACVTVEDWTEANARRLEDEAEEEANAGPVQARLLAADGEYDGFRQLLGSVLGLLGGGQSPEQVHGILLGEGIPEGTADAALSLILLTLSKLQEGLSPPDVMQNLNAQGVPSALAMLALEMVLGEEESEPG